jgi:hypothetical protein
MKGFHIYKGLLKGICLLVIFSGLFISVKGQKDTLRKRPSLGEHTFTPVSFTNLPFTSTYFNTITGMGQTSNLVYKLNLIDGVDLRGLKGELTFVDLGFAYQQRVRDWLAAYVKINVSARVGTELQSILLQGVNTVNSFEIGWHIKLVDYNKIALSTIVELQNHSGSFISVAGFVKDILDGHPNPSLNRNVPLLGGATGMRFAWGINDFIGIKASADLMYGESFERGKNDFYYSHDIGVDLDFYPKFRIPAGMVFNYSVSTLPDLVYDTEDLAQMVRWKVAYTKAVDFSLGIEYSYQKIPLLPNEDPATVHAIALTARYYF